MRAAPFSRWRFGLVVAAALIAPTSRVAAGGIDPESNPDGFNPAADLSQIGEARRQDWVARQRALHDAMVWSSGYVSGDLWGPPLGGPPVRQPYGYESRQVAPNRWIYRPLYAEEVAPSAPIVQSPAAAPAPSPSPGRAAPNRPGPSDPDAFDLPPPPKAPARGPREF